MDVNITTFQNPFSFFCKIIRQKSDDNTSLHFENTRTGYNKASITDVNHGQYVAVLWKNKWVRGIVSMESQFLIWLVDHGFSIRPDGETVYTDLTPDQKKTPTKVFEASIHGVVPVDKTLSGELEIINKSSLTWNKGAIAKAQELLSIATHVIFVPIAILSTDHNDIVLGDLYLKLRKKGLINIMDELEKWPIFLAKNKDVYIKNLANLYTNRRKHRACSQKLELPYDYQVPTIKIQVTTEEYNAICEKAPKLNTEPDSESDCESFETKHKVDDSTYKLTPDEIEQYSHMFIDINGTEFNVLQVILNKIRDLKLCEKYKHYDNKSVGRANTRIF